MEITIKHSTKTSYWLVRVDGEIKFRDQEELLAERWAEENYPGMVPGLAEKIAGKRSLSEVAASARAAAEKAALTADHSPKHWEGGEAPAGSGDWRGGPKMPMYRPR